MFPPRASIDLVGRLRGRAARDGIVVAMVERGSGGYSNLLEAILFPTKDMTCVSDLLFDLGQTSVCRSTIDTR